MKHIGVLVTCCILSLQAREKLTVVVSMIEPQRKFFEQSVVKPFSKENGVDITVINSEEIDAIADGVSSNKNVGLFMVPFGDAWSIVDKKRVQPLGAFLSKQELRVFNEEYILTWLGRKNGEQYFMPCKYETRILVYRKSKVAEAVKRWNAVGDKAQKLRDSIGTLLRPVNGYGLPEGYTLETKPDEWDYFDLFVVGAVWASMTGNKEEGRIGHRGKKYSGTALRVIDRVFQCGGDSLTMLAMNGDPVIDAFLWEAIYASFGIYNSAMFSGKWSGKDLWQRFNDETIYLSFLTQVDCFFIHGHNDNSIPGHLEHPEDLGFSVMPKGCSVELGNDNRVKREGTRTITNGGWWWAIPAGWNDVARSYQLFQYITSRKNQLLECTQFGSIPVRNDVFMNDQILVNSGWISEVFRVSYRQVKTNNNTVIPAHSAFAPLSDLYLDAWFSIIAKKDWSEKRGERPDRSFIVRTLSDKYMGRASKILER